MAEKATPALPQPALLFLCVCAEAEAEVSPLYCGGKSHTHAKIN